jgi:hypothetical protein
MERNETPTDESTTDDLMTENRKLRKRVDELESQLSEIQERLDRTTDRSAGSDEAAAQRVDPTASETTSTVNNVTNPPAKVIGEFSNSSGVGVYGENTASSGENFGVEGVTNSSNFSAGGVYGRATDKGTGVLAEAAKNYAVTAISTGSGGIFAQSETPDVSGIRALNTASTGKSLGVLGRSESSDTDAAGVKGQATADSGETFGVIGTTNSSDTDAAGIKGVARANSGSAYGVVGKTNSTDGLGLYTPDDARLEGSVYVSTLSVGAVGATPVLNSFQDIVDGGGIQTVAFDEIIYDDFNGFDDSTGEYTIQELGDYHITININTETTDAEFDLLLRENGSTIVRSNGNLNNGTLTKTVRVLQSGDVITAAVVPQSGDFKIDKGYGVTYMDIDKIG